MLQLGIGVIEFAGAVLHPGLQPEIGGMNRFGGRTPRQRGINVARHKRQQFLVTQGIAHR
ncbi:hypothetical protein D3C81_1184250 [compost metagenome]